MEVVTSAPEAVFRLMSVQEKAGGPVLVILFKSLRVLFTETYVHFLWFWPCRVLVPLCKFKVFT